MKKVCLIGVPLDLGANKRGASGGPAAIRRTRLLDDVQALGLEVEDWGDVEVPSTERVQLGNRRKRYASAISRVCSELKGKVYDALGEGGLPVILGGDHSLALGSVAGASQFLGERKKKLGLIWMDAHGDMNTPSTTLTGNVHGMPLAFLMGVTGSSLDGARLKRSRPVVDPKNAALVGVRDVDPSEREVMRESGAHVFSMKEIDRLGMARVFEQAMNFASEGTGGVHVSFDIDVVDPAIAQGVATPTRGGLTYREAHLFMELVADSESLVSLDMAEVNPLEDVRNTTAEVASELILSALGKSIF